jgi:GT2 family glycosyltransferase
MELSVIIVSYKCAELLNKCLESIYKTIPDFDFEVIVVDNDSQDGSEVMITNKFRNFKWINAGYNSGFSRANNLGIRNSRGKYVLLLNPDTEIKGDFLNDFVRHYKNLNLKMNLGLLGCRIISLVDKSLLVGSGVGFRSTLDYLKANPVYIYITRIFKKRNTREYKARNLHYRNHQVDFVSGACVMIEKQKIELNNLFLDEDFFLYFEDVEWSFRVKKSGLINFFCADVEVYHINSAITGNSKGKYAQMQISEYLYFFKTLNIIDYFFTGLIIYINFVLNLFLLKRNGESEKLHSMRQQWSVFKQYFWRIVRQFKRSPSSSKDFLKYV